MAVLRREQVTCKLQAAVGAGTPLVHTAGAHLVSGTKGGVAAAPAAAAASQSVA
jgi:hypothetical protein